MFNIGAMSINEIREKEDLDPVEGGDIHLVPMNMQPLDAAAQPPQPKPAANPEFAMLPPPANGNGRDKGALQ